MKDNINENKEQYTKHAISLEGSRVIEGKLLIS